MPDAIVSEITVAPDGTSTERYTLDGLEITRDEFFAAQFAAFAREAEPWMTELGAYGQTGA